MGNKRGFLLAEETLKIIVALIVIILLVSLLFALYFSNISKQENSESEENATENQGETIEENKGIFVAFKDFIRSAWSKIKNFVGGDESIQDSGSTGGIKGNEIPEEEIIGSEIPT